MTNNSQHHVVQTRRKIPLNAICITVELKFATTYQSQSYNRMQSIFPTVQLNGTTYNSNLADTSAAPTFIFPTTNKTYICDRRLNSPMQRRGQHCEPHIGNKEH